MLRFMTSLGLVVGLLFTSGCAAVVIGVGGAIAVSSSPRPLGQALHETSVSNEIKTKLLRHGRLAEVDVEVAGGIVLLSGRVQTLQLRIAAENIAWSVRHGFDLANEIRVEDHKGLIANIADEIISARVRARLIGSSAVKARRFNVETYDGIVYLMGIARSRAELEKTAEEASLAGGVKRVVSYMRVDGEDSEIASRSDN